MSLVDNFVVKTAAVSSTGKAASHLLPNANLTAKDTIEHKKNPFHVDDRLKI